MNKTACILLSYNRPEYLKKVLQSLKEQTVLNKVDFFAFQDGAYNVKDIGFVNSCKTLLEESKLFQEIFDFKTNIGVGFIFDKAEKYVFEEKKYEQAIFFEDDMVLSPHYIDVIIKMFEKYNKDTRIGMISAYGSLVPKEKTNGYSIEEQESNSQTLISMHHNWSFGITRKNWIERQPLVQRYLDLFLKDKNYRERNTSEIINWMKEQGYKSVSSQDSIKNCSILGLNKVRITCFPNYAIYIGKVGLHSTEEIFNNWGFNKNIYLYNKPLENFPDLTEEKYKELLKESESHYKIYI